LKIVPNDDAALVAAATIATLHRSNREIEKAVVDELERRWDEYEKRAGRQPLKCSACGQHIAPGSLMVDDNGRLRHVECRL